MAIPLLLNNESLKKFVIGVKMGQEDKGFILSKLPEMNFEERKALFKTLLEIKLLNLKREKAIERVKKFWQK